MPLAAAVVPTAASLAQQITTSITGKVTNESGASVGGANVVIVDTRTGATTNITTDSTGGFTATGLTTGGPYTVTANANGFQGQTVEGIQTTLQGPTQLTFALARPSGAVQVALAFPGRSAQIWSALATLADPRRDNANQRDPQLRPIGALSGSICHLSASFPRSVLCHEFSDS